MKSLTKFARAATVSVAALLLAAPASAADADKNPSDAPAVTEQPQSGAVEQPKVTDEAKTDAMPAITVALGQAVWSSDGEELGKVSKINLDATGHLESIYFDVGTTLGIGGKTVMTEVANFSQNKDRIELKLDAKAANALPAIKTI